MKRLEERFTKNGCVYSLIQRKGKYAIYSMAYTQNPSEIVGYDAWVIREKPEQEVFGRVVHAREIAPGGREYGCFGWSYTTLDAAQKKLSELIRTEENTALAA